MKIVKVNLKKRSYNIVIGSNLLKKSGKLLKNLKLGTSAYIITNAKIKNRYGQILSHALGSAGIDFKFRLIPDSEKSKSLETAYSIIKGLSSFDQKKRVFIIALGGGVAGDLAGFVASIYKRGIPYAQIPTTLLAQVDSSIGGKTAVDLKVGKNLVGAFYQPKLVISDIHILKTLDNQQIRAGLSEVIKYGIIKDAALFYYLEKNYKNILAKKPSALEFIVFRSASIKAKITQIDEKETKGIRTILNFGHTIGHAIEAAGSYKKYNHGEAIALGVLVASNISQMLGLVNTPTCQRIEKLIKNIGLPARINLPNLKKIIQAHYLDKKFSGAKNRFVLLKSIGQVIIKENIPLEIIKTALKNRM